LGGKWTRSDFDETFGATEAIMIAIEALDLLFNVQAALPKISDSVIRVITRKPEGINKVSGTPMVGASFPKKLIWSFISTFVLLVLSQLTACKQSNHAQTHITSLCLSSPLSQTVQC
jgi:hypothetical protein